MHGLFVRHLGAIDEREAGGAGGRLGELRGETFAEMVEGELTYFAPSKLKCLANSEVSSLTPKTRMLPCFMLVGGGLIGGGCREVRWVNVVFLCWLRDELCDVRNYIVTG